MENGTYRCCRFRFSLAQFRFWWQSDGNFAGKLLGQLAKLLLLTSLVEQLAAAAALLLLLLM